MVMMTASHTAPADQEATAEVAQASWRTVVHDDPVNLMSYVSWVFESYFGYDRPTAERLMMRVHTRGRAVVSSGSKEAMERDAQAMHAYGLWATVEKGE